MIHAVPTPRTILRILALLLLVCGFALPARAQYYFGKNKVQYTQFDWQVMASEHFRIYFYKDELEIAKIAAHTAENAYRDLAAKFNIEVDHKVPLIIYSSPSYFAQTNVTPGLVGEAVGGFTEFMKGRVVVPFHGSYFDFEHVIRHEMVHVFQINKLDQVTHRITSHSMAYPPLWFTEGLAEFWSKQWDTEADMIIKDMVLDGHLIPIRNLYEVQGTYFMYKLGESICSFIDATYGPDKIAKIYDNWTKGASFDDIVRLTLGDDLNEVSRKWEYFLKKKYFPEVQQAGLPKQESRQISQEGFAVKGVPITWDDGSGPDDYVVFKANSMGYTGLYMRHLKGDPRIQTLLKGESSARFESLYLLRSGIDANDSGMVVFSSKSNERDRVYVYDLKQRKVTREFRFDNLVSAASPRFSPDGSKIVFSGVRKSGLADLYVIDLKSGTTAEVTDDIYYDTDPTWDLDGTRIVFASDRGEYGRTGALNLFEIDPATHQVTQLTNGNFRDQTPAVTKAGIYFSSNRGGTYNLFLRDGQGNLTRQSTYVTGAFDPRLSSDGKTLVYTGYQDQTFRVFSMKLPKAPVMVADVKDTSTAPWQPAAINHEVSDASISYDADYSWDIAQSSIAYDPIYGGAGGFQAALSDVLGNKAYYIFLSNTAQTKDDFLKSFNAGVTYVNRTHRLNWGLGVFHLYDRYYDDYDLYYNERQAGMVGLMSYPISKFSRFDFTNFTRYDKKDYGYGLASHEGFLTSNYLSWVYDNSLWDITGPIEGRRYNLTIGLTQSIDHLRAYNRVAFADIRHYLRLGRESAFANRLYAYTSDGIDPQRQYLGGSWSFRGFDRRQWYSRHILFASNEVRFPLIHDLYIGSPLGDLGFKGIQGALFADVGSAWDDKFDRFYGSFGFGTRINVGGVVLLRLDFSRTTDFQTISPRTKVDVFFGWNF